MKWISATLLALATVSVAGAEFKPKQVVPRFEAITDPEIAPAAEAEKWVHGNELVLGVVVGNEARAYPINQLTNPTREIINDTLGDRSIAATW